MPKFQGKLGFGIPRFLEWYHLDLNQGHTDFQSVALPTELWYLILSERKSSAFRLMFQMLCHFFSCESEKNHQNDLIF